MTINYSSKLGFGLPTDGDTSWGEAIRNNYIKIENIIPDFQFAERKDNHINLDFAFYGGNIVINEMVANIPNGSIALAGGVKNFIEAHIDGGVGKVSVNQAGFSKYRVPLFEVTTTATAISSVIDRRSSAFAADLTGQDNQIAKLERFSKQLSELSGSHDNTATAPKFALNEGTISINNATAVIASTLVALANDTKNFIEAYIDASGVGQVAANTVGFTRGRIPLYTVTTSAGTFTAITDNRAWLQSTTTASSLHDKTIAVPASAEDGKFLAYDHTSNSMVWKVGLDPNIETRLANAEKELGINQGDTAFFDQITAGNSTVNTHAQLGYKFSVTENILVKSLTFMFYQQHNSTVMIWDASTQKQLASFATSGGTAKTYVTMTIATPVNLESGKEYIISYDTAGLGYQYRHNTSPSGLDSRVSLINGVTHSSATTFPTGTDTTYLWGVLIPIFGVETMKTTVESVKKDVDKATNQEILLWMGV